MVPPETPAPRRRRSRGRRRSGRSLDCPAQLPASLPPLQVQVDTRIAPGQGKKGRRSTRSVLVQPTATGTSIGVDRQPGGFSPSPLGGDRGEQARWVDRSEPPPREERSSGDSSSAAVYRSVHQPAEPQGSPLGGEGSGVGDNSLENSSSFHSSSEESSDEEPHACPRRRPRSQDGSSSSASAQPSPSPRPRGVVRDRVEAGLARSVPAPRSDLAPARQSSDLALLRRQSLSYVSPLVEVQRHTPAAGWGGRDDWDSASQTSDAPASDRRQEQASGSAASTGSFQSPCGAPNAPA